MMSPFRIGVMIIFTVCIAGCAIQSATAPDAGVESARITQLSKERVKDAVAIGRSTKADVIAALGEAAVIRFESGYEVWVYRLADDLPAKPRATRAGSKEAERETRSEFVILFAPSGLATKTRLRLASQPG
jgi:hypothetical protein